MAVTDFETMQLPMHADASNDQFLHWLVQYISWAQPSVVVEAGTFMGHFALVCGRSAQLLDIPLHVWTCDVSDFGAAERATQYGLTSLVTIKTQDFAAMLEEDIGLHSVDLAYIDSGPTDGVTTEPDLRWRHFNAVMPHMRKGGIILVDDTQRSANWAHKDELRAMGVTIGTPARSITMIEAK